jgi:hypothetical protein
VSIKLTNPSDVDLSVTISGLPQLYNCDTQEAIDAPAPVTVPARSDVTVNVGCVLVSCPAGLNLEVTVQGTAISSTAIPCIYTSTGTAITTDTSTCTASVTCVQPITCRVTGGGVLIPNEPYVQDCNTETANATTMVHSTLLCNGAEAVKVTHGGQLGAPFSQQDCGEVLGNPCIRGQWEHVRHYQGKANPQTVIAVDNFHSNTPKGIFDSLKCACLPCCENPDATGLVNGLCNPDDHKICGPEPRPAPANAIIFTGVGYIKTCATSNQKGKATEQPVIFMVYIEDRSEPGGSFPGGANRPDDIYCFQAWGLNGTNIDSPANQDARRAVARYACDFIDGRTSGALAQGTLPSFGEPIINDCGALHTGNQQIHPSTSATCNQ